MAKKIFIFFKIFLCFIGYSQETIPNTDFRIENQKIIWQHVFEPEYVGGELKPEWFVKNILPKVAHSGLVETENRLSFSVSSDRVNFKKYGGTAMGTPYFAQFPQSYLVAVDFKERKYRVTVSNIAVSSTESSKDVFTGTLEDYVARDKNSKFRTNKIVAKGMEYLDKHYHENFEGVQSSNDKW